MSIEKLKVGKETEQVDLSEFSGVKTKIRSVSVDFFSSKYHSSGKVKAVLVETEPVTTIKVEGEDKEIGGSELLNLKEEGGEWVISPNKDSNVQKFMSYHGVTHVKDLVGKACEITLRPKISDGKELHFLGIKYK